MYIEKMKQITHDTKYRKWYINIVLSAPKIRPKIKYTEAHHILPKSFKMGGEKDKENIVYLTGRQHYIVHKILTKIMISEKHQMLMICAFAYFSNNSNRQLTYTSKMANDIREANSKSSSHRNKGNQNWKHRAPTNTELKQKRSEDAKSSRWVNNGQTESFSKNHDFLTKSDIGWVYGRLKFTDETKKNMAKATLERYKTSPKGPMSEETKKKLSEAKKGKKIGTSVMSRAAKCIHCGFASNIGNIARYHNNNCKSIRL